jgi:hypothetical protein
MPKKGEPGPSRRAQPAPSSSVPPSASTDRKYKPKHLAPKDLVGEQEPKGKKSAEGNGVHQQSPTALQQPKKARQRKGTAQELRIDEPM